MSHAICTKYCNYAKLCHYAKHILQSLFDFKFESLNKKFDQVMLATLINNSILTKTLTINVNVLYDG